MPTSEKLAAALRECDQDNAAFIAKRIIKLCEGQTAIDTLAACHSVTIHLLATLSPNLTAALANASSLATNVDANLIKRMGQ